METAEYFREKAAQCRRLAAAIANQDDPVVANLLAMAVEFEARTLDLSTEGIGAARRDQSPQDER